MGFYTQNNVIVDRRCVVRELKEDRDNLGGWRAAGIPFLCLTAAFAYHAQISPPTIASAAFSLAWYAACAVGYKKASHRVKEAEGELQETESAIKLAKKIENGAYSNVVPFAPK